MKKYYYPKMASSNSSQTQKVPNLRFNETFYILDRSITWKTRHENSLLRFYCNQIPWDKVSKPADTTDENETEDGFEDDWEVTSRRGKGEGDIVDFGRGSSKFADFSRELLAGLSAIDGQMSSIEVIDCIDCPSFPWVRNFSDSSNTFKWPYFENNFPNRENLAKRETSSVCISVNSGWIYIKIYKIGYPPPYT